VSVVFDPLAPELRHNPYPIFSRLQACDPIHHSPYGMWVITRYEDVLAGLRDPHTSNQLSPYSVYRHPRQAHSPAARLAGQLFALMDPPQHIRLRRLTGRVFREAFTDSACPWVDSALERLLRVPLETGEMEAMSQLAGPLPVEVISEFLGVPPADRALIGQWASPMFYIFSPTPSQDAPARLNRSIEELESYFGDLVEQRRQRPGNDLVSQMLGLRDANDRLSQSEVVANCLLLFSNGIETLALMLGNALWLLLSHPEQWHLLRGRPDLLESAVEECLRYESPSQIVSKSAKDGLVLGGVTIPAGDPVFMAVGAANRDPRKFPDPHRFHITRSPNQHLTFSSGSHSCLGAELARLECRQMLAFLSKCEVELLDDLPSWKESLTLRGLEHLRVRLRAT
jgi:pimeloyl-[acyl-carrier protein] synthase